MCPPDCQPRRPGLETTFPFRNRLVGSWADTQVRPYEDNAARGGNQAAGGRADTEVRPYVAHTAR